MGPFGPKLSTSNHTKQGYFELYFKTKRDEKSRENRLFSVSSRVDPVAISDTKLDVLAFPEIFCWGVGGKRGFRGEEAKPLQYAKCRLMSSNGATRRHIQHLFHLAGECERCKTRSSIFATLKNVQDKGNLDAASLLNMIKTKDQ